MPREEPGSRITPEIEPSPIRLTRMADYRQALVWLQSAKSENLSQKEQISCRILKGSEASTIGGHSPISHSEFRRKRYL